jgi:hypothetical protein
MQAYVPNRACSCVRCRTRGLMGGAILVTLGVLFLLEEYGIFYFDNSLPLLLIVIGLLSFAARSGSIKGHVQPHWASVAPPPPAPRPDVSQTEAGRQQEGDPYR